MELREFLAALRSRWIWPVTGLVLGAALGLGLSLLAGSTYRSATQFYISSPVTVSAGDALAGNQLAQQQVSSFAQLLSGETLAQRVIDRLKLPMDAGELQSRVTVNVPVDTTLIDVSVTDDSAAGAQRIATALGDEFIGLVGQLPPSQAGGVVTIQAVRTQDASLPVGDAQPLTRNTVVGLLVGLLVGCVLAAVRSRLDESIRDLPTLSGLVDAPNLSTIARDRRIATQSLVAEGGATAAQSYRQLRNHLQLLSTDRPPRTILVAGAVDGAGASTVAANLAIALTTAGREVALVDADLRRATLSSLFGLADSAGLSDVINGRAAMEEVLQEAARGRLDVLPAGTTAADPDEILTSKDMASLLAKLRADYDFVLIDAPPLLSSADAGSVAALADGVVLCVRFGRTTTAQVEACRDMLDHVGAALLGTVLNFVPDNFGAHRGVRRTSDRLRGGRSAGRAAWRPGQDAASATG